MDAANIQQFRRDTVAGFKKGLRVNMTLTHYLAAGFLPTPMASDTRGGYGANTPAFLKRTENSRGVRLPEELQRRTGMHFRLSPRFVLEMMGFPPDWTELPFLPGATNPCEEPAMQ
jgi:hypothetical protein